jgi:hypothetical protein
MVVVPFPRQAAASVWGFSHSDKCSSITRIVRGPNLVTTGPVPSAMRRFNVLYPTPAMFAVSRRVRAQFTGLRSVSISNLERLLQTAGEPGRAHEYKEHFETEMSGHFSLEMSTVTLLACDAAFFAVRGAEAVAEAC